LFAPYREPEKETEMTTGTPAGKAVTIKPPQEHIDYASAVGRSVVKDLRRILKEQRPLSDFAREALLNARRNLDNMVEKNQAFAGSPGDDEEDAKLISSYTPSNSAGTGLMG
jgi:hypothetical protein